MLVASLVSLIVLAHPHLVEDHLETTLFKKILVSAFELLQHNKCTGVPINEAVLRGMESYHTIPIAQPHELQKVCRKNTWAGDPKGDKILGLSKYQQGALVLYHFSWKRKFTGIFLYHCQK